MPNLGMGELIIVLLIVLLLFGAKKLPQIGEGVGKAIRGLKRGLNTDDDIQVDSRGQIGAGDERELDELGRRDKGEAVTREREDRAASSGEKPTHQA